MNSINLVKLPFNTQDIKKDKDGISITNVNYVYGIAKSMGKWGGENTVPGSTCLVTNNTAYGPSAGVNSIQWAMQLINNNSTSNPNNCNKPQLICSSAGGTSFPNTYDDDWYARMLKLELKKWPDTSYRYNSISNAIESILNPSKTIVGPWWDEYYSISLTKISGIKSEIFSFKIQDVFNETGIINDLPLNIQDGLYSILIQAVDGSSITILREIISSEENKTNTDADYLGKSIFPVPIIENQFSINLTASKNLNFTYLLYDFNMHLIYNTKIRINEGESRVIIINPDDIIPNSTLLNQFIFEDGSQSSIITVK